MLERRAYFNDLRRARRAAERGGNPRSRPPKPVNVLDRSTGVTQYCSTLLDAVETLGIRYSTLTKKYRTASKAGKTKFEVGKFDVEMLPVGDGPTEEISSLRIHERIVWTVDETDEEMDDDNFEDKLTEP